MTPDDLLYYLFLFALLISGTSAAVLAGCIFLWFQLRRLVREHRPEVERDGNGHWPHVRRQERK
jgi:hypothetical protein